jgi:hypothetical protein
MRCTRYGVLAVRRRINAQDISAAVVACSAAFWLTSRYADFLSPPAAAQSQNMTVRPTSYAPGATLGNPGNAIDNNDSTTSGAALGRQCSTTCTTPTSATATWRGTPDGFRPIRLEIHWQANAITSLYGNDTASIDAKVEYSLDGGGVGANWNITRGPKALVPVRGTTELCALTTLHS